MKTNIFVQASLSLSLAAMIACGTELDESLHETTSAISIRSVAPEPSVLEVPSYNQNNNEMDADCGLTSLKMIFRYYGPIMNQYRLSGVNKRLSNVDEEDLARVYKPSICDGDDCDWTAYGDDDSVDYSGDVLWGTSLRNLGQLLKDDTGLDFDYYSSARNENDSYAFGGASVERLNILKAELRHGRPVIVHIENHYILATGYSDFKGEFYFNDPSGVSGSPKGKQYSISQTTFFRGNVLYSGAVRTWVPTSKTWDGRMFVVKPPIERVNIRMKANYPAPRSISKSGLYFEPRSLFGLEPGEKIDLQIGDPDANDGNWHVHGWNLEDGVIPVETTFFSFSVGMSASFPNTKYALIDRIRVKRFRNGEWATLRSKSSVKDDDCKAHDTWYVTRTRSLGKTKIPSMAEVKSTSNLACIDF